jgi:hypothetical protein
MKQILCDRCESVIVQPTIANEVRVGDCSRDLCCNCNVEFQKICRNWFYRHGVFNEATESVARTARQK